MHKSSEWWLGHTDQASEGNWILNSTGSSTSYTNWNSGEPNGGTSSNCVQMYGNGYWDDFTCTNNLWAMCEKAVQIEPKGKRKQSNFYNFYKMDYINMILLIILWEDLKRQSLMNFLNHSYL